MSHVKAIYKSSTFVTPAVQCSPWQGERSPEPTLPFLLVRLATVLTPAATHSLFFKSSVSLLTDSYINTQVIYSSKALQLLLIWQC